MVANEVMRDGMVDLDLREREWDFLLCFDVEAQLA